VEHHYVIFPFFLLGAIAAVSAIPVFFLVEGEGFGSDDSPLEEEDSDLSDDEHEDAGQDPLATSASRPVPYHDGTETPEDPESRAESEYGGLGRMVSATPPRPGLERTWSIVSSSVAESVDEDLESVDGQSHTYGSVGTGQEQSLQRRNSRRRLRRKSSAPLGIGPGFRRMSTNLGQTRSGFGDGNSFAGGVQ
jgi:hypothetical protein